jgi:hypothetical protein
MKHVGDEARMLTCDICGANFEDSEACGYGLGDSVLELDGLVCQDCYHRGSNSGDPAAKLTINQAKQRAQNYLSNQAKLDIERKNFLEKTVSTLSHKNPNHPVLLMFKEGEYWGLEDKIVKVLLGPFKLTQLLLALQDEHIYPAPTRKKKGLFGRSYIYWPNGAAAAMRSRIQISQTATYNNEKSLNTQVTRTFEQQEKDSNNYATASLNNPICPKCGSKSTVLLAKTGFGDRYKCENCTSRFSTTLETQKNKKKEDTHFSNERWEELCRKDLGFKLSYPWNWKVTSTSQGIEMCPQGNPHTFDPVLKRDVTNPGVNITVYTGIDPTQNMVEKLIAARPNGYEQYEFVQKHELIVNNANHSAFYEFRYGEPNYRFSVITLIVQEDTKMFIITASGKCSDFPNSRGEIWKMMHSFQLLSTNASFARKEEIENKTRDVKPNPSNINRTSNGTYTTKEQWERSKNGYGKGEQPYANPYTTNAVFETGKLVFECPNCRNLTRIALSEIKPIIGVNVLCENCKNVAHVPSGYRTTPNPADLKITGSVPVTIAKFGDWYFSHPLIESLINTGQSDLLFDYGLYGFCAKCYHQYQNTILGSLPIAQRSGGFFFSARTTESANDMNALRSGHCPSCGHDSLLVIAAEIPEYVRIAIHNAKR